MSWGRLGRWKERFERADARSTRWQRRMPLPILSTALERVGGAPEHQRLRGRALVMLGEAHARAGAHESARKACEEAAANARGSNDPELLAEAALALGVEIVPGVVTAALVALLQEAIGKLPPTPTPLRARVLARLAAALQPAKDPSEPIRFAREALAMARALGDTATIRACLHMGGSALVDLPSPTSAACGTPSCFACRSTPATSSPPFARIRGFFSTTSSSAFPSRPTRRSLRTRSWPTSSVYPNTNGSR